jgi:hypothetical protein
MWEINHISQLAQRTLQVVFAPVNAQISGAALTASDCICLLCGDRTLLEYNR